MDRWVRLWRLPWLVPLLVCLPLRARAGDEPPEGPGAAPASQPATTQPAEAGPSPASSSPPAAPTPGTSPSAPTAPRAEASPASAPATTSVLGGLEPRKFETSGPAVLLGIGYKTPILGAELSYYYRPPASPTGVAGCLGIGWIPPIEVNSTGLESESATGFAVGAMGFFGQRHRVTVDLSYGAAGIYAQGIGNILLKQETLYGVTAAAGYEFLGGSGFLFRAGFGATLVLGDLPAEMSRVAPTLNLALGYKIF